VALLDQLLTKEMNTSYLIFDKAERLRGEFQFIVNALLRLNEQVRTEPSPYTNTTMDV
jgi:hypothetical protein